MFSESRGMVAGTAKLIFLITVLVQGLTPAAAQSDFNDSGIILPGTRNESTACADYDRDGKNDIAVAGGCIVAAGNGCSGYAHSTFHNEGSFIFSEQTDRFAGTMPGGVAFGDYNLDGYPDVALTGFFNVSSIYDNNQTSFSRNTHAGLIGVAERNVAWADYDNDGELELIAGGMTSEDQRLTVLYDNEAVYPLTPTPTSTPTRTPTIAPAATHAPHPVSTVPAPTATPAPTDIPDEPDLDGAITGSVTLEDNPVEGVTIRITGAHQDSVETDEDGEFAFSELPNGEV